MEITQKRDRITLIIIYVFKSANIAVPGLFGTIQVKSLSKGHTQAQTTACIASRGTRDEHYQFEITRKRDHITLINIYVLEVQILLFWAFSGTLRAIFLSKGHARAQLIPYIASRDTRDNLHQLEITQKLDRITLINSNVFKSANIAVSGLS